MLVTWGHLTCVTRHRALVSWVSVGKIIAPPWLTVEVLYGAPGQVGMVQWGWTLAIAAQVCGVRDDKEQLKVGTILQSQSTMNSHSLEQEDLRGLSQHQWYCFYLRNPFQHRSNIWRKVHWKCMAVRGWHGCSERSLCSSLQCNAAVVMPASCTGWTAVNPAAVLLITPPTPLIMKLSKPNLWDAYVKFKFSQSWFDTTFQH